MTPGTYVRMQDLLLLIGLLVLALVGAWELELGLTAAVAITGLVLVGAYRRAMAARGRVATAPRPAFDRIVARSTVVLVVVGALVGAVSAMLDGPALGVEDVRVRAILLAAACGVAGAYLASLVDWWWVLPRITGQLGPRPCRAADHRSQAAETGLARLWLFWRREQKPAPPFSWEETTRYWYANRILAALVVIVAAAVVVLNVLKLVLGDGSATSTLASAGGVLALLIGAYRQHLPWAVMEFFNPRACVGDMLLVDGEEAWCVDVSLEGVKYIDMKEHRSRWQGRISTSADQDVAFKLKSNGSVPLTEAKRIRQRDATHPCPPGGCTGANWYCVQNPRRYEKPR